MPRIRLQLSEVRAGALPPVCLVCGRPATSYISKSFSWRPPSAIVLSFLIMCVCLPVALALYIFSRSQMKRMTVHVPLCDRHRNYWAWRAFGTVVPGLVLTGMAIAFAVFNQIKLVPEVLYFPVFLAIIVMFMIWLALVWFLNKKGVRAEEITDDEIILHSVSLEFHDMVRYERTNTKGPGTSIWDEYDPYPRGVRG
jgi:hypothetical protein